MRELMVRDLEFKALARDAGLAQRHLVAALDQLQEGLDEVGRMIDGLVADAVANPSAENKKAIRLVRETLQELL